MVTKERKLVSIVEAERIFLESKNKKDAINKLHTLLKRQPKPPPPEGGISLREAARKYGVHHTTILKWVKKGLVPIIKRTPNWLYVDEAAIQKIKKNGGLKVITT